MGVSGTKYFGINDDTNMETVAEFVSVATVFETDGEVISLKTIDKEGRILDDYEQRVSIPKPKNCTDCAHFAVCGGTGKTEQEKAKAKARSLGRGALAVQYNGGLTVKTSETVKFSDEDLATLGLFDIEFSVRRKNKLFYERKRGFELRKLLEKAGFDVNAALDDGNADYILNFTAEDGLETVVRLRDIIDKNCYDECIDRIGKNYDASDKNKGDTDKGDVIYELRGTVPAMIYEDFDSFEDVGGPDVFKSNYRLVYGQKNPYDYNGRRWAHHIAEISVIDLNHFKHD